jgi:hypothetical protein
MSRIKRINQYGVSNYDLELDILLDSECKISTDAFGPLHRSVNRQICNPPGFAKKGRGLPSKALKNIPKRDIF